MELKQRHGVWHAHFYVVDGDGERQLRRRSTGIKVEPASKPKQYKRSLVEAQEAARQLQRVAQLEASGLRRQKGAGKSLERAVGELIAKKELGKRSQRTIDIVIEKATHLFRYFGPGRDITTISAEELEAYARHALEGRKAGSVAREIRHLREAIRIATDVVPPAPDLGIVYTPRSRFFEPEQFERLLNAMDRFNDQSGRNTLHERRDWIIMNAYLGLTQGRLQRITHEDIDLQLGTLLVQHAGTTKNTVHCPQAVREVLARRLNNTPIFPPWTSMSKRMKELCQRLDVPRPNPDNLPQLLAAWDAYATEKAGERKRDYLVMYVHLGLTYGELYRIGPGDIDWDGNLVFVAGTKTAYRKRAIPMTEEVRDILTRRSKREPMFPRWHNSNMLRDIRSACELAGLDRASANDLRRTFATWLAREGVPLINLSKLMGHSGTKMLEHVYARVERGAHMQDAIRCIPPTKTSV